MLKQITTGFLAIALVFGGFVSIAQAQTSTSTASTTIQVFLAQLQALQTQIAALKAAQTQVGLAVKDVQGSIKLLRGLQQGMSGEDIEALQAILAADPEIYPEGLVTGFYGRLTAQAVMKFQKKHGLEQVGFVGPRTLAKLNDELTSKPIKFEVSNEGKKRICTPPGHLIAPGWLKKHGNTGTSTEGIVPLCKDTPPGIAKKLGGGGVGTSTPTTTPDTIAPVISNLDEDNVEETSAQIEWDTNEKATSWVWYGTMNPLVLASSSVSGSATLTKDHEVDLTGLATSTVYYYMAVSADASGNTATSSQATFTTDEN